MKPIFIALLEHGEEQGLKGTSLAAVLQWAEEEGYLPEKDDPVYKEQKGLLRGLFFESFEQNSVVSSSANSWGLKIEYYYRLLEYRELTEARTASSRAQITSIAAIILSLLTIILSGYIGYLQLKSPVKLSNTQYSELIQKSEKLIKSNEVNGSRVDKLVEIMERQIEANMEETTNKERNEMDTAKDAAPIR
jgi:hypothetical protein